MQYKSLSRDEHEDIDKKETKLRIKRKELSEIEFSKCIQNRLLAVSLKLKNLSHSFMCVAK